MAETVERRRIAWAPLILVSALGSLALGYLFDARGVSLDTQNLLLLQPTAWLVLLLWAVLAIGMVRMPMPADAGPQGETGTDLLRVLAMVGAFAAFIGALEIAGYDIAIFAFSLIGLLIGGERKPLPLLLFPLGFTLAVIYGFRLLVPYPFPTSLL